MMRSIPTLLFALLLAGTAHAQKNIEIGMSTGYTHYYGDLGNWSGPVQWNSARPGMALTVRGFLNNNKQYVTRALDWEFRMTWHRIGYDETEATGGKSGWALHNFGRGLNFRNDLFGLSSHLVLNAYREPFQPLFTQRFFAYFFVGVGVFYGRPKADLFRGGIAPENIYHIWSDGTIHDMAENDPNAAGSQATGRDGVYETDLYEWHTEGGWGKSEYAAHDKPTPWHIGFPWGFGIRYMVTRQLSLGAEFAYYSFITDRLDDVSDRYATFDEIDAAFPGDTVNQFLAKYISDPTGKGTIGYVDERTSARGNPLLPDYYSYLSIEISFKLSRMGGRRLLVKKVSL